MNTLLARSTLYRHETLPCKPRWKQTSSVMAWLCMVLSHSMTYRLNLPALLVVCQQLRLNCTQSVPYTPASNTGRVGVVIHKHSMTGLGSVISWCSFGELKDWQRVLDRRKRYWEKDDKVQKPDKRNPTSILNLNSLCSQKTEKKNPTSILNLDSMCFQ